jgi:hypothetical protein
VIITSFVKPENIESSKISLICGGRADGDLMKAYYLKSQAIADLNSGIRFTFNIELIAMSTLKSGKSR